MGLELVLKTGSPSDTKPPAPGEYWPVDLPPINRGTPIPGGDQYRDNIATCNAAEVWPGDWLATENGNMVGPTNQGMRDLIAQDPDAVLGPDHPERAGLEVRDQPPYRAGSDPRPADLDQVGQRQGAGHEGRRFLHGADGRKCRSQGQVPEGPQSRGALRRWWRAAVA
jgi:hypothetical protein